MLREPATLHCIGGFVVATLYGLQRTTADLDCVSAIPSDSLPSLLKLAGPASVLAEKYGVHLQFVSVASLPDGYTERLIEIPGNFRRLRLLALEAHDLALSKLARNSPIDREDVAYLAKRVPLNPTILRDRYRQELRPTIIGDPERHDQTLELWVEAYFP